MFIYGYMIINYMAYIRLKSIKGKEYAYLVESIWDKVSRQPRQVTIKYLGRVDKLNIDIIPKEYRSDPKVLEFISRYKLNKSNEVVISTISNDNKSIVDMLSSGDIDGLLNIFNGLLTSSSSITNAIIRFYEEFLIPALHEVGELWMQNRLGIAVEHVCSNTANSVIKNITYIAGKAKTDLFKGLVIIATPNGELHNIACNMIESILVSKGYRVLNISPSAPRDVIIKYVEDKEPDALLVSVTLPDNVGFVERLVKALRASYSSELPIIIGGNAASKIDSTKDIKCIVVTDDSLSNITSIVDEEVTKYRSIKAYSR